MRVALGEGEDEMVGKDKIRQGNYSCSFIWFYFSFFLLLMPKHASVGGSKNWCIWSMNFFYPQLNFFKRSVNTLTKKKIICYRDSHIFCY